LNRFVAKIIEDEVADWDVTFDVIFVKFFNLFFFLDLGFKIMGNLLVLLPKSWTILLYSFDI
jgi:hypothetical protein